MFLIPKFNFYYRVENEIIIDKEIIPSSLIHAFKESKTRFNFFFMPLYRILILKR